MGNYPPKTIVTLNACATGVLGAKGIIWQGKTRSFGLQQVRIQPSTFGRNSRRVLVSSTGFVLLY